MNSSRESSLKSFNSGNASQQVRHTQGSQNAYQDNIIPGGRLSQVGVNTSSNINKEERKALVNHNALISSIHNYVN
jgi:hypothetical protein